MHLEDLNRLDREAAEQELLRCCGSTRWAQTMAAAMPFADADAMAAQADKIWRGLPAADWLEAFAAHPRIGETGTAGKAGGSGGAGESGGAGKARRSKDATGDWAADEQAGVGSASDAVRDRLAEANRQYEARFGYIFIVCATGRQAGEMLAMLERRLTNRQDDELQIAAEEQRRIMRLRLAKLLQ